MYSTHITSRPLEMAGAWYTSAQPIALRGSWGANGGDVARLSVIVTYTRGGSGGYPKLRLVWTHARFGDTGTTIVARDITVDGSATVTNGAIQISSYRTEVLLKGFSDLASADSDVLMIEIPPGATHLKVECAEVGNVAAPGTIVIDIDGEV